MAGVLRELHSAAGSACGQPLGAGQTRRGPRGPVTGHADLSRNKQRAPKMAFCLGEDMEETALNVGYGRRSTVTTDGGA